MWYWHQIILEHNIHFGNKYILFAIFTSLVFSGEILILVIVINFLVLLIDRNNWYPLFNRAMVIVRAWYSVISIPFFILVLVWVHLLSEIKLIVQINIVQRLIHCSVSVKYSSYRLKICIVANLTLS